MLMIVQHYLKSEIELYDTVLKCIVIKIEQTILIRIPGILWQSINKMITSDYCKYQYNN